MIARGKNGEIFLEVLSAGDPEDMTSARDPTMFSRKKPINKEVSGNVTLGKVSDELDKSLRNLDERDDLLTTLDTTFKS